MPSGVAATSVSPTTDSAPLPADPSQQSETSTEAAGSAAAAQQEQPTVEPDSADADPDTADASADASSADAPAPDEAPVPSTLFHPLLDANFDRLNLPEPSADSIRYVNEMGYWADKGRFGSNCHYVVNALELRFRGYNVIASPTVQSVVVDWNTLDYNTTFEGRFLPAIAADWVQPDGSRRDFDKLGNFDGDSPSQALDALTSSWPEGGRGFIAGYWRDGGGHIFTVVKEADGVKLIDGQVNDADVSGYLDDMHFDPSSAPWKDISVLRVDDLVPTSEVIKTSKPCTQDEYQLLLDWGSNSDMADRPQTMIDRERAANTRWQDRNDELIAERLKILNDPDTSAADRERAEDEVQILSDQKQRLAEGAKRFELEVDPPEPPQTPVSATGSGEN